MMNATDTPVPSLPVFDYDDFMERMDGDMDLLKEVIEIFLEDAPNLVAALRLAVSNRNGEAMERAAHTLKGAAANISAKRLQQLSHIMQETIKKGDVAHMERLFTDMETHYEVLDRVLRARLKTLSEAR
ncbi:MAG: Hpt domain-containing protein [Desulfosalsimonadaceae bacterium]